MKTVHRLILLAGVLTLAFLLWHFHPQTIWADVSQIGLVGLAVILPFQICDHLLNALGWRFAFAPEDAGKVSLSMLVRVRVAGDGVNYLTPSGQIAGEFVRPALMGGVLTEQARNASVALAKFAQALGQAVFVIVGLLFVVLGHMNVLDGRELVLSLCGALLVVALISLAIFVTTHQNADEEGFFWRFGGPRVQALRGQMRGYMKTYPARFVLSTLGFTLGYAWGMLEVMLICRFMGLSVDPLQALAIETLSNIIDAAMFMVPAKVGTQEAGKTAIFKALGLPAAQGLAFGLIRHLREFVWASAGFTIYALGQRRRPSPGGPSGGSTETRASLAGAD